MKALVLKTSDPVRDRGFESHILRLNDSHLLIGGYFFKINESALSVLPKSRYFCRHIVDDSGSRRNTQEAEGAPLERE